MGFRIKENNVVKRLTYRGFFIEVIDTGYWYFRYEYRIIPKSRSAKQLLKAQARKDRVYEPIIRDPTSMKTARWSMRYAKWVVDDCWSHFVGHMYGLSA